MTTINILRIIMRILFAIELIVFPAIISDEARRAYGRVFGTRIDTNIYHYILISAAIGIFIIALILCL